MVENVGGAGGMNGTSRVARGNPDGYEAVVGGTGTFAANQTLYKHPSYNALTDFTPVGLVAEQPLILVTRKDFPADNLQQFIAYTKANHANLRFASGGTGSATHLGCVLLNSTLGVDVTHVPYRSTALAVQDMIAGRIDYACPIASTALSQVQAKQLKAIAILTKTRSPILPELATAQEQGLAISKPTSGMASSCPRVPPPQSLQSSMTHSERHWTNPRCRAVFSKSAARSWAGTDGHPSICVSSSRAKLRNGRFPSRRPA